LFHTLFTNYLKNLCRKLRSVQHTFFFS
jgi:hypothetical protein